MAPTVPDSDPFPSGVPAEIAEGLVGKPERVRCHEWPIVAAHIIRAAQSVKIGRRSSASVPRQTFPVTLSLHEEVPNVTVFEDATHRSTPASRRTASGALRLILR